MLVSIEISKRLAFVPIGLSKRGIGSNISRDLFIGLLEKMLVLIGLSKRDVSFDDYDLLVRFSKRGVYSSWAFEKIGTSSS